MPWELDSDRPIYTQLMEQIELKVCAGLYPPGGRLPRFASWPGSRG